MTNPSQAQVFERIETSIRAIDETGDPATQACLREIVQSLLDYHGAAVGRLIELIEQTGRPEAVEALAGDDLVSGLLLLYDLHPLDVETRVRQALDKVRPYLRSHGGEIELLGIGDGVVHLRLQGSCQGCPSSRATMQSTIEQAIFSLAPDVVALDVAGLVDEPATRVPAGFVALESVTAIGPKRAAASHGTVKATVAGEPCL
ncbi:MAG TPA: NifU family protein [Pirellulales bacterium]|nr:NifU family protein [Pirellulales bacterium]